MVVLKRLSEAEADGDRIWAVIRGSAVNHGGASVGLTVPHTPALEQVMETALSEAGVDPSEVDYLEAHGTGTAVGDPIELDAVASVYGRGREAGRPLLTGSVKTNIGHLESAAGVAGLIKAALVVKRGVIPKHLHFENPNPSFDWDGQPLRVTSTMMDWPRRGQRPRLAGVNSFGISGTNAHLVVEEYPGDEGETDRETAGRTRADRPLSAPESMPDQPSSQEGSRVRRTRFLPLSGKSEGAVRDLASAIGRGWKTGLRSLSSDGVASEPTLSDMAWTAAVGRSHFDYRAGAVFHDVGSAARAPQRTGRVRRRRRASLCDQSRLRLTRTGQPVVGMGRDLYESEPVARAVLDRCEAVFREERGVSLLDVMFGRGRW